MLKKRKWNCNGNHKYISSLTNAQPFSQTKQMWVRFPFAFSDIAPSSSKEFLEKFRQPQSVDSKTSILHDKNTQSKEIELTDLL